MDIKGEGGKAAVWNTTVFGQTRGRRAVTDGDGERVYTAIVNMFSVEQIEYRARANVRWRIKKRSREAVNQRFTGSGMMSKGYTYPDTLKQLMVKYHSKQLSPEIVVGGVVRMNFCAMLRRAGQVMANYCLSGDLTVGLLSNNMHQQTTIAVVNNADNLSTCGLDTLYFPNSMRVEQPGVFDTLYLLACATHANIAFDNVVLAPGQAAHTVLALNATYWSKELHNSILYMLRISDACSCGPEAVVALLSGLHSVYSVVGHSDEGALMRDVLREIAYEKSFGVVVADGAYYRGQMVHDVLYAPSWDAMCAIWDYAAVASAGVVALSDPCSLIGGDTYPTILTAPDVNDVHAMEAALEKAAVAFFPRFVSNASKLFGVSDDGCGDAVACLMSALQVVCEGQERGRQNHIRQGTMAPWFWVEPTGLYRSLRPFDIPGLEAGYGPMCVYGQECVLPAMDTCEYSATKGNYDYYNVAWTTIRRQPLLTLLNNRVNDGIANIIVGDRQNVPWILEGQPGRRACTEEGHGTEGAVCGHRRPDRGTLDEFLWGRFSSALFHPAELTAITNVRMKVKAWVEDDDGNVLSTGAPPRSVFEGSISVRIDAILLTESTAHIRTVPVVARTYRLGAKYIDTARQLGATSMMNMVRGGMEVRPIAPLYRANGIAQRVQQRVRVSIPVESRQEVGMARAGGLRINAGLMHAQAAEVVEEAVLQQEAAPIDVVPALVEEEA